MVFACALMFDTDDESGDENKKEASIVRSVPASLPFMFGVEMEKERVSLCSDPSIFVHSRLLGHSANYRVAAIIAQDVITKGYISLDDLLASKNRPFYLRLAVLVRTS